MSKKIVLLSYSLNENTPTYGNGPKPRIESEKSMDMGDSCNSYKLIFSNHSGTHVDAPAHFIKEGKKISEYSQEELVYSKVFLLELPKEENELIVSKDLIGKIPKNCECILIRTGFWKKRDSEEYIYKNPGISSEAMEWLRKNFKKIECIGIDTISITAFSNREEGRMAHKMAFENGNRFGSPLLLIEDMNLGVLNRNQKIKKLDLVPLQIEKLDSAPCMVIAEVFE